MFYVKSDLVWLNNLFILLVVFFLFVCMLSSRERGLAFSLGMESSEPVLWPSFLGEFTPNPLLNFLCLALINSP